MREHPLGKEEDGEATKTVARGGANDGNKNKQLPVHRTTALRASRWDESKEPVVGLRPSHAALESMKVGAWKENVQEKHDESQKMQKKKKKEAHTTTCLTQGKYNIPFVLVQMFKEHAKMNRIRPGRREHQLHAFISSRLTSSPGRGLGASVSDSVSSPTLPRPSTPLAVS